MSKFNKGLDAGRLWNHVAIAGGPVGTATGTGAGGPDEASPDDYQQIPGQVGPGELAEAGVCGVTGQALLYGPSVYVVAR